MRRGVGLLAVAWSGFVACSNSGPNLESVTSSNASAVTAGLTCGTNNPSACIGRATAKRKAAQQQCQALHGQSRGVCESLAATQFQTDVTLCQAEGCLPAEHCCDDVCVPVSDANCEACGLACTGGKVCEPDLNLAETGHCSCPAGDVFCGGTCVSSACRVSGQVFNEDPSVCACECPSGRVPCDGQCVSSTCSNGTVFDSGACGCECPHGTVICGGSCVSNVCPGAQAFDPMSCGCQCPPSSVVACPSGQFFDTTACACVSSGITVLVASYGSGNCGTPVGDVTGTVAGECNGLADCAVFVDNSVFGDPSFGCPKDFAVNWQCGSDPSVRTASHGPVAGEGYTVSLTCH